MKTTALNIRVTSEYRAKVKKDAAFFDMSISELVLESINCHVEQLHNGVSKGIAEKDIIRFLYFQYGEKRMKKAIADYRATK